ncbi:hypothetical protein [Pandoraea apista]|uniref:hypothetical protein n=1 Tax=Pandoraea apista TaxID=93218 RepID=UPI002F92875E
MSIDLALFCAHSNDPRTDLHKPWFDGGWIAATDGAVMVALSAAEASGTALASEKRSGSVARFIEATAEQLDAHEIHFPSGPRNRCDACNGAGYELSIKCKACDGEGEFSHCNHTYECKSCDGEGFHFFAATATQAGAVRCVECNGLGKESQPVKIGAAWFQEKYLRRIAELPDIKFFPPPDATKMAKFVFVGGIGFLMPYRHD